jgi:two-component system, NarL family, nitrate/nitrite response regulator NarL
MGDGKAETIKVLILDDHELFRESLARLLAGEGGFDVLHCDSIEEALSMLRQRPIDIVLLDLDLGQRDGRQFMRLAKQHHCDVKILVVTAGVLESDAAELIRAGVCGIFMKHYSPSLLTQGIRDVMAGKVWLEQRVLDVALKRAAEGETDRFTQRERQVLSHLFEGLGNKEIAAEIGVSESSVKATLQQLFAKTGVRTRSQLVRIALEQYNNKSRLLRFEKA